MASSNQQLGGYTSLEIIMPNESVSNVLFNNPETLGVMKVNQ